MQSAVRDVSFDRVCSGFGFPSIQLLGKVSLQSLPAAMASRDVRVKIAGRKFRTYLSKQKPALSAEELKKREYCSVCQCETCASHPKRRKLEKSQTSGQ